MSAMGGNLSGLSVLDLFAGSGALGLEALSRGAARVVFVERSRSSLRTLEANIEHLGVGAEVTVVADDVFKYVRTLDPHAFDVALADPPYAAGDGERLVEVYKKKPFANALWLEHPWREELPLPDGARTRRYGDTALSTVIAES
jgi:16S rRNA (guanine966-N2)-methyltransferase